MNENNKYAVSSPFPLGRVGDGLWSYALFADRGFTGHEHLPEFGLINMNGRLYDPLVGRFLSPDNYVQDASSTQNFNRYGYCVNNPLRYTDPEGEWFVIDDAIAAVVGGTINLVTNWGNVDNFWEGLGAFGAGAASGWLTLNLGPAGAVIGGAITGAANNIIAQTGNGVGLNQVNWGQVGFSAGVGGVSGIVGYGAAQWATNNLGNAVIGVMNINSPVLSQGINGMVGGAAGGYAGGFTSGFLFSGGDLKVAAQSGWSGLKTGAAIGGGFGAASGYAYAKANGIDPWSGKKAITGSNVRTEPSSLAEKLALEEAQSGKGTEIMSGEINDPQWKGWQKIEYTHRMPNGNNITIHYWRNSLSNALTGFKFKTPPH